MKLLLVEDNPGDALLFEEMLRDVPGLPFQTERVETLAQALQRLELPGIELVMLDLGLPDSEGLDTLVKVRHSAPEMPLIVLTGFDDEERALLTLQNGAQDYLVKGGFESGQLSRVIRYAAERNQIEGALRRTVRELELRTDEMESFTYSVSHDLKEPLRTLEAFSRFLIEDYGNVLDELGRDYLSRLAAASGRLRDMIEELLTLSRLTRRPHEFVRVDARQVIEDIISAAEVAIEEKKATVRIEGELPDVLADLVRIEQVFGNLISNAIKFNHSRAPLVTVGVAETTSEGVTFFVRDNGIGIEEEYQERIFGVFQRLHLREEYEGTGAGLAIVKRACEAVNGSVRLESKPGEGATFYVTLQRWLGSAGEEKPAESAA